MTTQTPTPTDNERLTRLEAVGEQTLVRLDSMERRMDNMEQRIDNRFNSMEQRMDNLEQRVDNRFNGMESRFNGVDQRVDNMEQRMEQGFESIREEIRSQRTLFFTVLAIMWGSMVAGFVATFAAIIATA